MALSESEELELLELEELEAKQSPQAQPTIQGPDYQGAFGKMAPVAKTVADVAAFPGKAISSIPLIEEFSKTAGGGPLGLGQRAIEGATGLFKRGGEMVAENLAQEGIRPLFAQEGIPVSPRVAAGMGTLTEMAPDIAMTAAVPQGATNLFGGLQSRMRQRMVAPNARRALGKFPASMSTEEANQIGLTALDKGVIRNPITRPFSSGRAAMLERATNINESIGENIGNFLKGQGEGLDVPRAMRELDAVKAEFMNDPQIVRKVEQAKRLIATNASSGSPDLRVALNLRGKTYVGNPGEIHVDLVNRVAQELGTSPNQLYDDIGKIGDMGFSDRGQFLTRSEASARMGGSRPEAASLLAEGKMRSMKDSLLDPRSEMPPSMDFSKANKLKGLFQKKVNYKSDAATQDSGKSIAGTFRRSIDTQLDELAAKLGNKQGMETFKADKKMFGQTRQMQDVLEKQAKRDERNMPVSLPSVGVGIGGFIKSGGMKGISAALAAEWVKKYGNAAAASMINDVANVLSAAGKTAAPLGTATLSASKILKEKTLSKEKAAEFLDEANGDKVKARELAKEAGYTWKTTSSIR